jgi:hypothetical protein
LVVDATTTSDYAHLADVRSTIAGALYGAGAGNGQGSLIVLQPGQRAQGRGNPAAPNVQSSSGKNLLEDISNALSVSPTTAIAFALLAVVVAPALIKKI